MSKRSPRHRSGTEYIPRFVSSNQSIWMGDKTPRGSNNLRPPPFRGCALEQVSLVGDNARAPRRRPRRGAYSNSQSTYSQVRRARIDFSYLNLSCSKCTFPSSSRALVVLSRRNFTIQVAPARRGLSLATRERFRVQGSSRATLVLRSFFFPPENDGAASGAPLDERRRRTPGAWRCSRERFASHSPTRRVGKSRKDILNPSRGAQVSPVYIQHGETKLFHEECKRNK